MAQPLDIAFTVMEIEPTADDSLTYHIMFTALVIVVSLFCYASIFGAVALTADRFLAIHLHLRYRELVTHKRAVAVVVSIWVLSAFVSTLYLWIN